MDTLARITMILAFFGIATAAMPSARAVSAEAPSSEPAVDSLAQEMKAAFERVDALGFPDTKDLPCVLLTSGANAKMSHDSLEAMAGLEDRQRRLAFLLAASRQRFEVWTLDLHRQVFDRIEHADDRRAVDTSPVDLDTEARRFLECSSADRASLGRSRSLTSRTEAILLARACVKRGHPSIARELCARVLEESQDPPAPEGGARSPYRLVRILEHDIAEAWTTRATLSALDPETTRREILNRLRDVAASFPDTSAARDHAETIHDLEELLAEDEAFATNESGHADSQTDLDDARLRELVHRIRDTRLVIFWRGPGQDMADFAPQDSVIPEILSRGLDALPYLAKSMEDNRPSRSVGVGLGGGIGFLTIGTLACKTVSSITGRSFHQPSEALAWHRRVEEVGMRTVLEEQLRDPDPYAWDATPRLVVEYLPDQAVAILTDAMRRAEHANRRAELAERLIACPGDDVTSFWRAQLQAPDADMRLLAARALIMRGSREGIDSLAAKWQQSLEADRDRAPSTLEETEELHDVVGLLIRYGGPAVIESIADDLERCREDQRRTAISAIHSRILYRDYERYHDDEPAGDHASPLDDPASVKILEKLLVANLHDATRTQASTAIADQAAEALATLKPDTYAFDPEAPDSVRERQRAMMQNTYRVANGQKPSRLPKPPAIPVVSDETLAAFLEERWSAPAGKRAEVRRGRRSSMGLGALPGIERILKETPRSDPHRVDLERIAGTLERIVRVVEVDPSIAELPNELARAIEARQGRIATPRHLSELFSMLVVAAPPGRRYAKIIVERPSDGTGVTIRILLAPDTDDSDRHDDARDVFARWEVDTGHSTSMAAGFPDSLDEEFREFAEVIDMKLRSRPREALRASLLIEFP